MYISRINHLWTEECNSCIRNLHRSKSCGNTLETKKQKKVWLRSMVFIIITIFRSTTFCKNLHLVKIKLLFVVYKQTSCKTKRRLENYYNALDVVRNKHKSFVPLLFGIGLFVFNVTASEHSMWTPAVIFLKLHWIYYWFRLNNMSISAHTRKVKQGKL